MISCWTNLSPQNGTGVTGYGSQTFRYPTRIPCHFQGKDGQIVLDQIRTVDKIRLVKKLGQINTITQKAVLTLLAEMFAE